VSSVREAIDALDRDDPNVVVTDVGVPSGEAGDLVRLLREREATRGRHVPTIALTNVTTAGDAERSLRAGFDRHVGKPTDPDELVAVVHELCRAAQ
jgi:DNA-binding response OmpR family regulator